MSRVPPMPAKIILKSTTSQTLSDRFTELAKEKIKSPPQVTITGIRNNQAQIAKASMKNRRLAAQLARRPGLQNVMQQNKNAGQGNLKSRLGTPNKAQTGNLRGRLGSPRRPYVQGGIQRGQMRGRGRGRGRGNLSTRGGMMRGRGGSVIRGGRGGMQQQRGARGGRGRGQNMRGRGGQAGRGRGRFARGRGGRGGLRPDFTKEMLDSDLDTYMSHTGKELDAELDEYMKQVGDN